jgi:hypothetical protein
MNGIRKSPTKYWNQTQGLSRALSHYYQNDFRGLNELD